MGFNQFIISVLKSDIPVCQVQIGQQQLDIRIRLILTVKGFVRFFHFTGHHLCNTFGITLPGLPTDLKFILSAFGSQTQKIFI